jgi:hypothetical protein
VNDKTRVNISADNKTRLQVSRGSRKANKGGEKRGRNSGEGDSEETQSRDVAHVVIAARSSRRHGVVDGTRLAYWGVPEAGMTVAASGRPPKVRGMKADQSRQSCLTSVVVTGDLT